MKEIIYNLSNREISLLIWGCFILSFVIVKIKPFSFIKALFTPKLNILYLIITLYLGIIIFGFNKLGLWETLLYKDFIIWFLGTGVVLFFNSTQLKSVIDFKNIFIKLFSAVVVIEFIINFYNFSLIKEIIFVPFITFIVVTHKYSEIYKDKKDYVDVEKVLRSILSVIGYCMLIFITYKTITTYKTLFTIFNLKSLLLPIVFTILFLPKVYLLAILMKYETILNQINRYQFIEPKRKTEIKKAIIIYGNINIDALDKIKRWEKGELRDNTNIKLYFKSLANS